MELVLFFIFSSLAIISGLMVIRSENPVHSVLFLILVFFNTSGLLLLLEVEFLAMLFIIVYVGAIAVLFLFVVMMLNIKVTQNTRELFQYLPIGGLIGGIFLLELFIVVRGDFVPLLDSDAIGGYLDWSTKIVQISNIEVIGQIMYTHYFAWFLIAGFILLVSMIGAIVLTINFQHKAKHQLIFKQLARSKENSIYLAK